MAIRRLRVRSLEGEEVPLDVYAKLQSEDAMPQAALAKMVRGVSCRDYEDVVDTARAGFGVKKSSVSRNFVQATREQVQKFCGTPLRRHHVLCRIYRWNRVFR